MEVFLIILVVTAFVSGVGFIFYRLDPDGWKSTGKRVTRFIRAEIESRGEKKSLTAIELLPEEDAREAWESEFKGKPKEVTNPMTYDELVKRYGGSVPSNMVFQASKLLAQKNALYNPVPKDKIPSTIKVKPPKLKHEIVKTDYYKTHLGPWPQWHCKCGIKQHTPVGYTGMEDAQEDARREAADHVKTMNEAEEARRQSNGKFAF